MQILTAGSMKTPSLTCHIVHKYRFGGMPRGAKAVPSPNGVRKKSHRQHVFRCIQKRCCLDGNRQSNLANLRHASQKTVCFCTIHYWIPQFTLQLAPLLLYLPFPNCCLMSLRSPLIITGNLSASFSTCFSHLVSGSVNHALQNSDMQLACTARIEVSLHS